jgi:signal transduction histidine kinase
MEQLVAELLELERLRAPQGAAPARADLVRMVRAAVAGFEHVPPGVQLHAPAEPVLLAVDAPKIRRLVRNLLENAVKYSLPDSRAVEVVVSSTRESITLRVSDDGPGIPEQDAERVFEPFYRVDPSRSKSTGGFGLGLSLCRRIAEAHGGAITVEPNVGRGASLVVTFPR